MRANTIVLQLLLLILPLCLEAQASEFTIIENVRVFDGETLHQRASVVIKGERIDSISISSTDPLVPGNAIIMDGAGHTLMPGLIDAHTHTFSRSSLQRSLDFGVTTSIDMGTTDPESHADFLREQTESSVSDRADIVSAGLGITAPGGHGTQFGVDIPTLAEDDAADAFVEARIAEGSEFIKLIVDDFSVVGFELPTLSAPQVRAVVDAAHQHDRIAVVHARDLDGYLVATRAGADGFVHALSESLPSDELLGLMREHRPFVIPTLTTTEGTQGRDGGSLFAKDEHIGPMLSDGERESLRRIRFREPRADFDFSIALRSVAAMRDNGTMILAGTDAPNPGTTAGASMHRELELLVDAGLTPLEALKAATANVAVAFDLVDRGRIKPGLRADLLLVEGNPAERITDTRRIKAVWKAGERHGSPPE